MKVVLQRSLDSNVKVDNKITGQIDKGLVILCGFTLTDTIKDIDLLVDKIIGLRIFDDENGIMNKSILDIEGSILLVSQFTLYADIKKGRRPDYGKALNRNEALELYNIFTHKLKEHVHVETGIFGSDMKLSITNDGPVTIIIESSDINVKK